MDEVTEQLEEAIMTELSYLNSTAEEGKRAKHIDNIKIMYTLLLEHEKEVDLMSEKAFQRGIDSEKAEIEAKLKEKQIKSDNIRTGVQAGLEIGRMATSGVLLGTVMHFEETSVCASKAYQLWTKVARFF